MTKVKIFFRGREFEVLTPRTYWSACGVTKHDVSLYIKYILCKLIQAKVNQVAPVDIVLLLDDLFFIEKCSENKRNCRKTLAHDLITIFTTIFKSKKLYNGMGIPSTRMIVKVIKSLQKEIEELGIENVLRKYLSPEEKS